MYFKTRFVHIFHRFVRFARVLLENLKKSGNHTFLDNSILVLRILSYLKQYLFQGISFFVKVDQPSNDIYFYDIYLMIPKFPIEAFPQKQPFQICLILGNCIRDTKWHPLFLQSRGLVEISPPPTKKKKKSRVRNFYVPPCAPWIIKGQKIMSGYDR